MTHTGAERPGPALGLVEALAAVERERTLAGVAAPEPELASYLGFFVGSYVYGLPIHQLRGVVRLERLRRIPGAPPAVAGLVNLRGEIICALDTRAILGLALPVPPGVPFLVVLRGFKDPIGLVVDSICDIYSIDPAQIQPAPDAWPAERTSFLAGIVRVEAGIMGLLELERVLGP